MEFQKFTFCLLLIMATAMMMALSTTIRSSDRIVFRDSAETETHNVDVRPGYEHRNRNHRGRGKGHIGVREFEEGLPGVYPLRGPPQLPYVLSTTVQSVQQVTPVAEVSRPNLIYQPARQPTTANYPGNQYSNNPFLKNIQTTTKSDTFSNGGGPITNRLPSADKPSTTTPSYQNPRRTDLLYGSNLLEEETNREGKSSNPEGIEFDARGIFNTPKLCPAGQVLVNDRCRTSV